MTKYFKRLILSLSFASLLGLSGCVSPKIEPAVSETLILKVDPVLLEPVPPLIKLETQNSK